MKPPKISDEQVAALRQEYVNGRKQRDLAKKYKLSQGYVSMLTNGSFRVPPRKIGTADQGSNVVAPDFVRARGGLKLVVNR